MTTALDQKLKHMESLIDQLVSNAEEMKEISKQVISKDELKPLQHNQEDLVRQINDLEHSIKGLMKDVKNVEELPVHKRITQKLQQFSKLNAAFIENVKAAHGLIHFEK